MNTIAWVLRDCRDAAVRTYQKIEVVVVCACCDGKEIAARIRDKAAGGLAGFLLGY